MARPGKPGSGAKPPGHGQQSPSNDGSLSNLLRAICVSAMSGPPPGAQNPFTGIDVRVGDRVHNFGAMSLSNNPIDMTEIWARTVKHLCESIGNRIGGKKLVLFGHVFDDLSALTSQNLLMIEVSMWLTIQLDLRIKFYQLLGSTKAAFSLPIDIKQIAAPYFVKRYEEQKAAAAAAGPMDKEFPGPFVLKDGRELALTAEVLQGFILAWEQTGLAFPPSLQEFLNTVAAIAADDYDEQRDGPMTALRDRSQADNATGTTGKPKKSISKSVFTSDSRARLSQLERLLEDIAKHKTSAKTFANRTPLPASGPSHGHPSHGINSQSSSSMRALQSTLQALNNQPGPSSKTPPTACTNNPAAIRPHADSHSRPRPPPVSSLLTEPTDYNPASPFTSPAAHATLATINNQPTDPNPGTNPGPSITTTTTITTTTNPPDTCTCGSSSSSPTPHHHHHHSQHPRPRRPRFSKTPWDEHNIPLRMRVKHLQLSDFVLPPAEPSIFSGPRRVSSIASSSVVRCDSVSAVASSAVSDGGGSGSGSGSGGKKRKKGGKSKGKAKANDDRVGDDGDDGDAGGGEEGREGEDDDDGDGVSSTAAAIMEVPGAVTAARTGGARHVVRKNRRKGKNVAGDDDDDNDDANAEKGDGK